MAGYDPFVELLPGEPIYSDGVAVTTEGVFPLIVGVTNLSGQIEAAAEVQGTIRTPTVLIGNIEAAAEVNGSTLTVGAQFVGWGIPIGV